MTKLYGEDWKFNKLKGKHNCSIWNCHNKGIVSIQTGGGYADLCKEHFEKFVAGIAEMVKNDD